METPDDVAKTMPLQRLIITSFKETLQRRRFCNVVRRFHSNYMVTSERRWIATVQQRCNDVIVSTDKDKETYTFGLLIGNDNYNDIILNERKKVQDDLHVINSKLGWVVSGRVSSTNDNEKENVMLAMTPASSCLPAITHLMTTERFCII